MAWSIFTGPNGNASAVAYAETVLEDLKLPTTNTRIKFIYDWEKSEGGGGQFNPLNLGAGFPGTTSGNQYGGGAANYESLSASASGVAEQLQQPSYATVLDALDSNTFTYGRAESAIEGTGWAAGHYGFGADWNTTPVPNEPGAANLAAQWWQYLSPGADIATVATGGALAPSGQGVATQLPGLAEIGRFFEDPIGTIWNAEKTLILRGFLILVGVILLFIGVSKLFSGNTNTNPVTTIVEGGSDVGKKGAKAAKSVGETATVAT